MRSVVMVRHLIAIFFIVMSGAVLAGYLPPAAASSGRHLHSFHLARFSPQAARPVFPVNSNSPSLMDQHGCCLSCGQRSGTFDTFEVCSPRSLRDHKPHGLTVSANPAYTHLEATIYRWFLRIPLHPPWMASSLLALHCALTI